MTQETTNANSTSNQEGAEEAKTPQKVKIYTNPLFQGQMAELNVGEYVLPTDLPGFDNTISSIWVPLNMVAELYSEPDFSDTPYKLFRPDAKLRPSEDNKVSAIRVLPESANRSVIIYDRNNYEGQRQLLTLGTYDTADIELGDNAVRSVDVDPTLSITLYSGSGFTGIALTTTVDSPDVALLRPTTSSIVVKETSPSPAPVFLNKFKAAPGEGPFVYEEGMLIDSKVEILGFPLDADFSRYATANHNGLTRIFIFKKDSDEILYQGVRNVLTGNFVFAGTNSVPQFRLSNVPADANTSSFAMLPNGPTSNLFLFMRNTDNTELISFQLNNNNRFELNNRFPIVNPPADLDWTGWGMANDERVLEEGGDEWLYVWKANTNFTQLYRASLSSANGLTGFTDNPLVEVQNTPSNSANGDFAMWGKFGDVNLCMPARFVSGNA